MAEADRIDTIYAVPLPFFAHNLGVTRKPKPGLSSMTDMVDLESMGEVERKIRPTSDRVIWKPVLARVDFGYGHCRAGFRSRRRASTRRH